MSLHRNAVIFDRLAATLVTLGFKVTDVAWSYGDTAEALVRLGTRKIARLDFSAYEEHVRLLVHPADAANHRILAGAGRIAIGERLEKELDDIESFFRTALVLRKRLDFADFPTDVSLRAWLAQVAEMSIPGDAEQVKLRASSPQSVKMVEIARRLSQDFERATAIRLHVIAADAEVRIEPNGRWRDEGLGSIRAAAHTIAENRYSRHALAWEVGTFGAHMFTAPKEAPARVELDFEEFLAPAM